MLISCSSEESVSNDDYLNFSCTNEVLDRKLELLFSLKENWTRMSANNQVLYAGLETTPFAYIVTENGVKFMEIDRSTLELKWIGDEEAPNQAFCKIIPLPEVVEAPNS